MKRIKYITVIMILSITIPFFGYDRVFYGVASYYGKKFHGRRTASGEIFNMYKLTAAHKTLPLGSLVKVTNLDNNKSIVVKVNDRGPYVGNRVMDLSFNAAKNLGFVKKGLTKIKAEVIYLAPEGRNYNPNGTNVPAPAAPPANENQEPETQQQPQQEDNANPQPQSENGFNPPSSAPTPAPVPAPQTSGSSPNMITGRVLRIQLGAFSTKENAEKWLKHLKEKGVEAEIVEVRSADNNFYKVYSMTKFRKLNEAFNVLQQIRAKGVECFIIGQYYARTSE